MKTKIPITITRLNLGGIGFTAEAGSLKKHKVYDLKMKSTSPHGEVDICAKISIIEIQKDETGKCECRALYRKLTDAQLLKLCEITDYYAVKTELKLSDIEAVITA